MFFHHTSLGTSPRAIEPAVAASLLAQGSVLVDIRSPIEFARGHVRGAVNIPLADPQFCGRAEQILPHGATLILMDDDIPDTLRDDTSEVEQAAAALASIGYDRVAGYVDGGLCGWQCANLPVVVVAPRQAVPQDVAALLNAAPAGMPQLIDVREEWEWEQGHLPEAIHIPLHQLERRMHEVDRCRPVVVYCRSGVRSRSAARMLAQLGCDTV
jgi:rhodanese-related sulfurtransferase